MGEIVKHLTYMICQDWSGYYSDASMLKNIPEIFAFGVSPCLVKTDPMEEFYKMLTIPGLVLTKREAIPIWKTATNLHPFQ